jgi:hypothetical protein
MRLYQPPELLAALHRRKGFHCRSEDKTAWLMEVAKKAHGTGTTRVFLVTAVDQPLIVADYAWWMANVAIQPITLLARLDINERHEGQGLSAALLLDLLTRVASLSDAIG